MEEAKLREGGVGSSNCKVMFWGKRMVLTLHLPPAVLTLGGRAEAERAAAQSSCG